MLRKSIPCMAAGLLFTAGLFLFTAAYIFPEWQPVARVDLLDRD
jgi:hypothetical protein